MKVIKYFGDPPPADVAGRIARKGWKLEKVEVPAADARCLLCGQPFVGEGTSGTGLLVGREQAPIHIICFALRAQRAKEGRN